MRRWNPLVMAAATLMTIACGPSLVRFDVSSVDPSAQGTVRVSSGPNNNTRLEIRVQHLARPERLAPGAAIYVVWARPLGGADAPPTSIGALQVNSNLEGRLDTLTALRSFELSITPELGGAAPLPSGRPIMTAQIMR